MPIQSTLIRIGQTISAPEPIQPSPVFSWKLVKYAVFMIRVLSLRGLPRVIHSAGALCPAQSTIPALLGLKRGALCHDLLFPSYCSQLKVKQIILNWPA